MKKVEWSDLPKELWPAIGTCLDNRIDVLRFRSVCKLWRSSVPPFYQPLTPPLPIRFSSPPDAMDAQAQNPGPPALLFQTTIYRMESLVDEKPNSSKPWIVKFEQSNSGSMRLVHPITNKPLRYCPPGSSKEFNLLDFRIVEFRKSYGLHFRNSSNVIVASVNKVVVMGPTHLTDCAIFMIYNGGNLGFLRIGDEKWTHVDEQNSHYDDLMVYKGQCYVVDRWGTISWVNSELKVIQFSPPLCGFGGQKHLVECCGDLYVVDRYLDRERSEIDRLFGYRVENNDIVFNPYFQAPPNRFPVTCDAETVDFKVYKLDQEWGRWVDVKNLGYHVFILSNDGSFSHSTRDFARERGNCILFTDHKFAYLPAVAVPRTRCISRVFYLEDGSIRTLSALSGYSQMLQPPSAWLFPN